MDHAKPLTDLPAVLSAEDIAAALHVKPQRARQHLAAGAFPGAVKIGKRWLLPRERFLEALGVGAAK